MTRTTRTSWTKYLFTLAVPLAVIGAGALWMVGQGGGGGTAYVYDATPMQPGSIRKLVSTSGPVRALVTVSVGSQLSGQVVRLGVDFNSEVKEGDVLAALDDKTYAARVAQARADLAIARAALANQQAALQRAQAVLKIAERTAVRQQTLAAKGIAAGAALDTATRDAEVARAEIAVAQAQIVSAKAQIEQKEAMLLQAEIDLERTQIRSPINGTVISRTIDVGQTVAASLQAPELFRIAQDLRRIRIEAQVNEADVGLVAEGNGVEFTVDAYPERKFRGRVTQVRLAATELASVVTYTVIIEAENNDRKLFPGMTANVQIESARRDDVMRIPNDAVRFKPRDPTLAARKPERGGDTGGGGGSGRLIDQLKVELKLDGAQAATVQAEMRKVIQEIRAQSGGNGGQQPGLGGPPATPKGDVAGNRARIAQRLEAVLVPLLREDQKALYAIWKKGREGTRQATIWVLTPKGDVESRSVRVGIADDQFTEVLGGALKSGEKVITRAREAKK